MFLRQMTDAFLVRTDPASSIVNPAHIHMTSPPQMRKEKVRREQYHYRSAARARRLRRLIFARGWAECSYPAGDSSR